MKARLVSSFLAFGALAAVALAAAAPVMDW